MGLLDFLYARTSYLLRSILCFFLVTHTPTLQGVYADALIASYRNVGLRWLLLVLGVGGTNRRMHQPTHPANRLIATNSHPHILIPTQPPCKVSAPTCIALQWNRSQDNCWSKVQIEEPPTQHPNTVKSLTNYASLTLIIQLRAWPIRRLSRSSFPWLLHFRTEWYEGSCMHRLI